MGRLRTPAAVFALALAVYAATLYPGLAPRDAGDMMRAAQSLGVAHPPGYPLYSVLGRLWLALFPWGAAAYRLNLLSAVCGALACALLAAWGERRGRWAGLACGLALAFCAPLWKFALLAEMYAPQAAFAAALLLLSEGGAQSFTKRSMLSGLLLGLGLVNHQSLVLLAPSGLWLWSRECRRHQRNFKEFLLAALPFALAGLLLYLFVPIRLHGWRSGWTVITRSEYGSLTLFSGFSRPLSQSAPGLLRHLLAGLSWSGSPLLLAAGGAGIWLERRSSWAIAAALGLLLAGPAFFLLTRFDVSGWVARSALEPAFLLPSLWLCVGAALLAARLEAGPGAPWAAPLLCAGLAAGGLLANASSRGHRDDFSGVDYARNLKRTLAPGSRAIVQGDTALFSLQLDPAGREAVSALEPEPGPVSYAVGVPLERAQALAGGARPAAAGLALALPPARGFDAWPLYAIRRNRALERGESYARDATFSYAFARHNAARLAELEGRDATADALWSAAWDPEDFGVELEPRTRR